MIDIIVTQVAPEQLITHEVVFKGLVSEWSGMPYGELAVLLAWLKVTAQVHQVHHWTASGDPFYGDHLLFDRLYSGVTENVDTVAEKMVGVGCSDLADPTMLMKHMKAIQDGVYQMRPGLPQPGDLATRSIEMEKTVIDVLDMCKASLSSKNLLTTGVDNMLADLADSHEGNVYLLKQRLGGV